MKAVVAALAALVAVASAQAPEIPKCIQSCFDTNVLGTCKTDNSACLCQTDLQLKIAQCVSPLLSKCSAAESTQIAILGSFCTDTAAASATSGANAVAATPLTGAQIPKCLEACFGTDVIGSCKLSDSACLCKTDVQLKVAKCVAPLVAKCSAAESAQVAGLQSVCDNAGPAATAASASSAAASSSSAAASSSSEAAASSMSEAASSAASGTQSGASATSTNAANHLVTGCPLAVAALVAALAL